LIHSCLMIDVECLSQEFCRKGKGLIDDELIRAGERQRENERTKRS
jgi:hypothetical protein